MSTPQVARMMQLYSTVQLNSTVLYIVLSFSYTSSCWKRGALSKVVIALSGRLSSIPQLLVHCCAQSAENEYSRRVLRLWRHYFKATTSRGAISRAICNPFYGAVHSQEETRQSIATRPLQVSFLKLCTGPLSLVCATPEKRI